MRRAKSFEFKSKIFRPGNKEVIFSYRINFYDKSFLDFSEKLILPKVSKINNLPSKLINNILDDLHLVLGLSYYKLYCPPKIILKKPLVKDRAIFWDTLYEKGLGEFFYRNKIDYRGLIKFPVSNNKNYGAVSIKRKNRSLVGIGGGKDSIVSAELLKDGKFDINGFVVQTEKEYEDVEQVSKILGINNLKIKRIIDKKVKDGLLKDAYNGHIPISSIYAFLGIFSAILYDFKYIIVSNEYSSNFGNINYLGQEINHQWSKSEEFELLLKDYSRKFITADITYFSLLRPFYEIKIAKIFSNYKKYFDVFSSCNSRFKISKERSEIKWCGVCPKCVFVFTMLSAFLSKKEVMQIFNKNLYEDKNLEQMFADILGLGKMKPFECVGTFHESQVALKLASKRFGNSYIVNKFLDKIKIDEENIKDVLSTHKSKNIPSEFLFLISEKILISGYGKEGRQSYKYLKNKFPNKEIKVYENVDNKGYKKSEYLYDLSIKSPGIPPKKIGINYTTATNIFLSNVYGKNLIIGITGSKGKSTTASLIYSILKEAKFPVKFLGNIGKPMLEALPSIKSKDILILELSSYQLEDINFSPNIAVVTNLFPDHMDYHEGLDNYYEAKKNIINFQSNSDIFFYNGQNKTLLDWAIGAISKAKDFSKLKINLTKTNLLGEHNLLNIKAAFAVSKYFNIKNSIVRKAIENFSPLSHRMEFIGKYKGINFFDDAISTTPDSTIMAIKTIKDVETIFLGGEDRGYDFSSLENIINKSGIKNIVLFPNSGKRILKNKSGFNIKNTDSMEEAVKFAFDKTNEGKACLLSCASPSYSLWENYEEKAKEFKRFIKIYSKK